MKVNFNFRARAPRRRRGRRPRGLARARVLGLLTVDGMNQATLSNDFAEVFLHFFAISANFENRQKRSESAGIGPNRGRERVQRKKLCRTVPSAARTEDFYRKNNQKTHFYTNFTLPVETLPVGPPYESCDKNHRVMMGDVSLWALFWDFYKLAEN